MRGAIDAAHRRMQAKKKELDSDEQAAALQLPVKTPRSNASARSSSTARSLRGGAPNKGRKRQQPTVPDLESDAEGEVSASRTGRMPL